MNYGSLAQLEGRPSDDQFAFISLVDLMPYSRHDESAPGTSKNMADKYGNGLYELQILFKYRHRITAVKRPLDRSPGHSLV